MRVDEQVVVVTGAGGGNGRAISRRLAAEGAHVVAADINLQAAEQTVEDIVENGGVATAVQVDVVDENSVQELFGIAVDLGGPHSVVAQAGVTVRGAIDQLELSEWNKLISVDVTGTFLTVREAIRAMMPRGGGSIVTMSGAFAYWSLPGTAGYAAAKGAILSFTRAVAAEYGDRGIRCNTIVPGYVATEMVSSFVDSQPAPGAAAEEISDWHALGRIAEPDEVAKLAVFLCSDESSFSTGSPFYVDGGLGLGINSNQRPLHTGGVN